MSSFVIRQGLVSIVMAAYNTEKYIAQAIASVQAQQYTNWELLIVNDGSKDQTRQIIENLAARDERIILINQENQGVSKARNTAFVQMQGEFFLIFDSDDILPPESISSRMALMRQQPNLYFVDGQVIKKDQNMSATLSVFQPNFKGNPHEALMRLDMRCFGLPSWLIRRQVDKAYRMETNMSHAEDLLFYIEWSRDKNHILDYVTQDVLHYRIHDNMAMKKLDGLERGYIQLYQAIGKNYAPKFSLRLYLRYRIARIMFLSFLRNKEIYKACRTLWRMLSM